MKIKWQALRDASSSCVMWQNLSAPSLIRQMELNGDNLHPSVSAEPLIKDEETNQIVMPKFSLFIPMFFDKKSILGCFQKSNCLDATILQSLAFFHF